MNSVAIILVNWNGRTDTLDCLESLREDRYPNKRVIVVDNGSSDGSVVAIKRQFPEVIVLEAGQNLGFTGGNNLGIRRALGDGADYVFILNNDTTVEPSAICALVDAAMANPNAGVLTPVINYFDRPQEPWFAGSRMDLTLGQALHDNIRPPARSDAVREIPWASGCAMLIPASVIQRLEGFDERFFLNWEDVELSLRVRGMNQYILLVPAARIYHKVSQSFARISLVNTYYYVRNQLLLLSMHAGQYPFVTTRIIALHLRLALRGIVRREPQSLASAWVIVRAIRDFLGKRFGPVASAI